MGQTRATKRAEARKAVEERILKYERAFREAMNHPKITRVTRGLWMVAYRKICFGLATSHSSATFGGLPANEIQTPNPIP